MSSLAEPASSINIRCRPLTSNDQEVQEIFADDQDYDELVKTRETDAFPGDEPSKHEEEEEEKRMKDGIGKKDKGGRGTDTKQSKDRKDKGRNSGSANEG